MDAAIASNAFAKAYLSARRHQATGTVQIPVVTDQQSNLVGLGRPAEWPMGVAEKVMNKAFRVQYLEMADCYSILQHTLLDPFQAPQSTTSPAERPGSSLNLTRARSFSVFERTKVGAMASKGTSAKMEDEYTAVQHLNEAYEPPPEHDELPLQSFFGVFDGHGGTGAARYVRDALHLHLCHSPGFVQDPATGMVQAFARTEQEWAEVASTGDSSGTTVVTVLVRGEDLYIANLGDSRATLCHNGKAIDLSTDHKPSMTKEQERIEQSGGHVINDYLNGELAVSRAIGDFQRKDGTITKPKGLSPVPEVSRHTLVHGDEFIVLACDGLWDVMSSQAVVSAVRSDLIRHGNIQEATEELVNRAVNAPFYSDDNVTAVVVSFMSDEVRQRLKDEQQRAAAAASAGGVKKWVPKFRRVQMDQLEASLKEEKGL